ncbi:hypothetical protein C2E23DRAFT_862064 [Lenzites betulinus]|nr:hypothetical protein C2E23DRAFT_862064 [Lenzites betulinus]
MRISQSSSLFLATLAISSSSSTLAAPTEPGSLDTTGLSSSSSIRSLAMAGRAGDSMSLDFGGPAHQANSATVTDTSIHLSHDRRDLLGPLLSLLDGLPLGLGSIIQNILQALGIPGGGDAAIESVSNMGNEQLAAVKAALQQALSGIKNTTGSFANGAVGTVGSVGSSIPSLHRRDGGPSAASSSMIFASQYPASSSIHSTAGTSTSLEALGIPTPAAAPALPVTPPALPVTPPALPVTPPALPVTPSALPVTPPALPVTPPALPVSLPSPPLAKKVPMPTDVAPPKGPIPRDAPPMFPAYKAAVAPSSTPTSLGAGSSDAASPNTMVASQSSAAVSQSAAASAPSVPA